MTEGAVWLGRSPYGAQGVGPDGRPLGAKDPRHVLLVGGTRGGKGTGFIVPNLCLWPGSVVCIDPKGENAMLTADARSEGRNGHPQEVYVLDPFNEARIENENLRASFNPVWELMEHDPDGEDYGTPEDDDYEPAMRPVEQAVDEAAIIASAIVVDGDGKPGQSEFWHGSARRMVSALILHVITCPRFRGHRSLITVRRLIMTGDEKLRKLVEDSGKEIQNAQLLMWNDVALNDAFGGIIHEDGAFFAEICLNDPEQFSGILGTAAFHTEFLRSPQLRKTLMRSSFGLEQLKTDERGVSLYFCLPLRYIRAEHYRWLRMLIGLATQQMEKTPGDVGANGYKVLMMLDEFTSLRRMSYLEEALTQYAGAGLKMFIAVQSLDRLKAVYPDGWNSFISQSGIKIFFNADDTPTREEISKLVGETEVLITSNSSTVTNTLTGGWTTTDTTNHSDSVAVGDGSGTSRATADAANWMQSHGQGTAKNYNRGTTNGFSEGVAYGTSGSRSRTSSTGVSQEFSYSWLFGEGPTSGRYTKSRGQSVTDQEGWNDSNNYQKSQTAQSGSGETYSTQSNEGQGGGRTVTSSDNQSHNVTKTAQDGTSRAVGKSGSEAHANAQGVTEQWHRRPIFHPEEVGRFFSGQDENTKDERWPGLALILIGGDRTIVIRRVNYYEDPIFDGLYNPHKDHPLYTRPVLALPEPPQEQPPPAQSQPPNPWWEPLKPFKVCALLSPILAVVCLYFKEVYHTPERYLFSGAFCIIAVVVFLITMNEVRKERTKAAKTIAADPSEAPPSAL